MGEEIRRLIDGLKAVEDAGKRGARGLEVLSEAAKNAAGGDLDGHR